MHSMKKKFMDKPVFLSSNFVAFLFCVFFFTLVPHAYAFDCFSYDDSKNQTVEKPVEVVADQLEFFKDEKKVIGTGNVIITYDDIRMTADHAEVYSDEKKAFADGHVVFRKSENVMKVEKGSYDFANNQGSFSNGFFF